MTNTTAASGPILLTPCLSRGRVYGWDVETFDYKVRVTQRSFSDGVTNREYFKATRVYGALEAFTPGFNAEETRLQMLITDWAVKDPALARHQRAGVKTAKAALVPMIERLAADLRAVGLHVVKVPADLSARFSIKAGCSMCPCSPGFVLSERLMVEGKGVDISFF